MAAATCKPFFFDGVAQNSHGRFTKVNWKGWKYEHQDGADDQVAWEIRRFFLALLGDVRQTLNLNKLLKTDFQDWVEFAGSGVFPSKKMFQCGPQASEPDGHENRFIREEVSCTTAALLHLMVFCWLKRRQKEQKAAALECLAGLLIHCMSQEQAAAVMEVQLTADEHRLCSDNPTLGICVHVCNARAAGNARAAMSASAGSTTHDRLIICLTELFQRQGCKAIEKWYRKMASQAASWLHYQSGGID